MRMTDLLNSKEYFYNILGILSTKQVYKNVSEYRVLIMPDTKTLTNILVLSIKRKWVMFKSLQEYICNILGINVALQVCETVFEYW